MAVLLELVLVTTFTLYFFVGTNLLPFSVALESLLTQGFVSGWAGPKLIRLGLRFWSHISLQLKISLHFLNYSWGVGEPSAQRVTLNYLACSITCIDVNLTSMSTVSTGGKHLKKPCRKLHSGCRMHAI